MNIPRAFAVSLIALAPLVPLAADESGSESPGGAKDWVFLENEHLRVGLLRSHGGAIGHLSVTGSNDNLLNHYDHGRLIQQSYYGNEDGSKWSDKPWRYNPVQGGDFRGSAALVKEFKSTRTTALVRTIPRHWASGELLNECVMQQWIELDGPVVHARYKFTYLGSKTHKARHQETPAVFVSPKLNTLVTYTGKRPWTNDTLTRRVPGWPNESTSLVEHWAAYVPQRGDGIGIYVPGATEATCYRYQGGAGSDCSYVAPLRTFALTPKRVFSYDAYFTIGNVETIRQRFYELRERQK